ncbi:hypothetical protein FHG87_009881 [Trinorchestia longiramus]|nr:hypothetical protein FHG87_009881 [Trinorchestia longiramus]
MGTSANFGLARPSSSMTNLANISKSSDINLPTRPGSALGLLGSVVTFLGGGGLRTSTTGSSMAGPQLKSGLPSCIASCLPPDLHHLIYTNPVAGPTDGLESQLNKLHNDITTSAADRRGLLEAELLKLQDDRKKSYYDKDRDIRIRRELDRLSSSNYSGSLSAVQRSVPQLVIFVSSNGVPDSRHEITRRLAMSPTSSPRHSSHARRKQGHRRQFSDPKLITAVSPLKEDLMKADIERNLFGHSLRNSSLNAFSDEDGLTSRLMSGSRLHGRRGSEGGLEGRSYSSIGLYDSSSRQKSARKIRKPRSWHPSPYASDDEDDMFSREEKKQKIKAEISRRRQQIEENSRLHEELLRLARLRETAELGFTDPRILSFEQNSPQASIRDSTSVLRSIDDILRDARDPSSIYYGNYSGLKPGSSPAGRYGMPIGSSRISPRHYYTGGTRGTSPSRYPITEEDRSIARLASTFQTDEFGNSLLDRISDYNPYVPDMELLNDFTPAMPLLPDMPTRSRKLLEDLGSVPISSQAHRSKYDMLKRHRK